MRVLFTPAHELGEESSGTTSPKTAPFGKLSCGNDETIRKILRSAVGNILASLPAETEGEEREEGPHERKAPAAAKEPSSEEACDVGARREKLARAYTACARRILSATMAALATDRDQEDS